MKRSICRSGLLWVCLAVTGLPGVAEVSTDLFPGGQVQIVVLGSTEGPDPFGMSWRPYRDIPAFRMLNAYGDTRGDGRPDIVLPQDGSYVVAWAWNNGLEHDIAVSEWTDDGWTAPQFLSGSEQDDLDPRMVATASETLHLVWWTRQNQAIRFASRQSGTNLWTLPTDVTAAGEYGRRPTVVVWGGSVHVAFERESSLPDLAQEVVIKVRNPDGTFAETVAARTDRSKRLDPVLHSENGWLWMEWKNDEDTFAYVVNGGDGWSEPVEVAWPDPSWVGVEDVRRVIRQIVTSQGESVMSSSKGDGGGAPRQGAVILDDLDLSLNSAPLVWNVNQGSGSSEQQGKDERKRP